MVYICEICDYKTTRLNDFDRHKTRKRQCKPKSCQTSYQVGVSPFVYNTEKVSANTEIVNDDTIQTEKVNDDTIKTEKINADTENTECSKCYKVFTRRDHMRKHEKSCDGLDKRQCKICLKMFASKFGKYQHIKFVKCVPPASYINNNITNNIYNTNYNNQNYITNNIRLCYGNEDLDQLCNEREYMKRIAEHVKMLKYALPRSIEDIYFNESYPNNQTIKKDRKNDNYVTIHMGDNKWETRLAKDTIYQTLETLQKYMSKYILEVKLNPAAKDKLKQFGKEMSKLENWSTESIEDRLQIDEYDEPDKDEQRNKEKEVCKLITDTLYKETRSLTLSNK